MQVCPRCGRQEELRNASQDRQGVLVCAVCTAKPYDFHEEWFVDKQKLSKALETLFRLQREYTFARNHTQNEPYILELYNQYMKALKARKIKYVILAQQEMGVRPLAEFEDLNLALAYALGWVGDNYRHLGGYSWVSVSGEAVAIDQM